MDFIKNNWKKLLIGILLILLIGAAVYYFYQKQQTTEAALQEAKILTEQQVKDMNVLQNELQISKQNAELLSKAINKAQTNQVQPVTHITVQAPTIKQASADVVERINKKDDTLPPAALEKTDRTSVVPQPENTEYQVGVYKINLQKDHRVKVGATLLDDKIYETVGYEQNRLESLVHFQGTDLKGATVTWTAAQW
ncbi:hypothetical protein [Propionispira raffinosivorans]|uniref:hypothetical protein n=1 Tax=Propionispira raffinosivorans TaxID=86959 RepID=UPI0003664FC6|nr:hypothetical protein [Propionispira raffinosivorans]